MATWSKLFSFFTWKNRPDTSTPLGQTLLNRLNTALNGIDDRVVTLNAEKASTEDLNGSIVNVRLDEKTGIFTFTRFDGTTFTINTALEEVATNFVYDYATQSLVLTLSDGSTQNIDLSALITQYEFTSSATILFTVGTDGKVTANIKPNSITDQMLQTNYLADITTQANTALSASQSALESQSLAEQSAEDAKEQADRAKAEADRAESVAGFTIDTELSTSSTNPIANKAVAEALESVDAKTLDGNNANYFARKTELIVERERINNLVANSGEQTEGNEELVDIRIGANGITYLTAGEAVRGQYNKLNEDIKKIVTIEENAIDLSNYPASVGYLTPSTGVFTPTENRQRTTSAIYLEYGITYTLSFNAIADDNSVLTYPSCICVYDSNGTYTRNLALPYSMDKIALRENEAYIRINYMVKSLDVFSISANGKPERVVTLNPDVILPATTSKEGIYIGARRPIISFIVDGEYDMNDAFEELFYNNGVYIGFAPQYTTDFENNSKETYLNWQNKGHEILVHSSYILKDGNYDDEVAKGYIKESYTRFKGLGFNVYGLIGSSGKIADKYLPTVEKYFRYCSSENNHSASYTGAGAESCLFFGTDSPFHLWRYSMEDATLDKMKDAVDRAISENGLLLFYGHAKSNTNNNFTVENVQALLTYITSKSPDVEIMPPCRAINEFYSIRYADIVT